MVGKIARGNSKGKRGGTPKAKMYEGEDELLWGIAS